MEGFSNINIFETKGLEYIIIIFFLFVLIPFWVLFNKKIKVEVPAALKTLSAIVRNIPQGLFFSRNHTWAQLEKSGIAKIGIDEFLVYLVGAGKINWLKLPGENLMRGELMAEIHKEGKRLKIFAPVSGEIVKTNVTAGGNPEILTADPYRNGWLYAVQPANWKAETSGCYLAEEATRWISEELQRLKDFLARSYKSGNEQMQLVYQEGGELLPDLLSEMPAEIWDSFQREFLDETN